MVSLYSSSKRWVFWATGRVCLVLMKIRASLGSMGGKLHGHRLTVIRGVCVPSHKSKHTYPNMHARMHTHYMRICVH